MPLHITSTTKSVKVRPSTKNELELIIRDALYSQGPDADLNFIDTSLITDMAYLFYKKDVHNIKIDEWDVSNVTNMEAMFYTCDNFNSDLSNWDVSKVETMEKMFDDCNKFNSDLSLWNTSQLLKSELKLSQV